MRVIQPKSTSPTVRQPEKNYSDRPRAYLFAPFAPQVILLARLVFTG